MVVNNFRPESTLKRAEELIGVKQSDAALKTLYDFITSKRTRAIQPADLEPIALLFVSLSVDLRNSDLVKDGLHQYKKNVQGAPTGLKSLENVVIKFIALSEAKLNNAQIEAATVDEDDDLEATISPEAILLSSVSTDDSKDRSDRDLLTPSLRFLWEAYRTVLDVLRNNTKLELTYHKIVLQAFQFCSKFGRKTEFHKLCDLLRLHVQSATNYHKQADYTAVNYIDLSDPDTLQRFLELRLQQLNHAVKLELWQESFRSIEDVHTLLSTSKRQPRPQMMVDYYENLAKVFAVSNNSLFHAAAWQRHFNLFSQSPHADAASLKHYASVFLLAALSIPQVSGEDLANQDFMRSKNLKLASLLNLPAIPTRDSVIDAIITRDLLKTVDPELAQLYKLLEEDFHPITFSKKVQTSFKAIESNEAFAIYVKPLTDVVLTRLFQQLSEVYETIRLDFLVRLCTFEGAFALSQIQIENYLVETAQKGSISVKIDHAAKVISFRSDPFEEKSIDSNNLQPTPAELVHSFLANLTKTLNRATEKIYPSIAEERVAAQEVSLQAANKNFQSEREEIIQRFEILQNRDRTLAEAKRLKEEEEEKARLERLAADRKAEAERKEQEALKRKREKIQREQEAIKEQEKKKIAEEINAKGIIKVDVDKLEDLDADKLRLMQVEQLNKEKRDLEEKLKVVARRLGHTERAYRKHELPLLAEDAEKQKAKDLEIYEEAKQKIIAAARKEHDEFLQLRDRLQRVVPEFEKFKNDVLSKKQAEHQQKVAEAAAKLEAAKQARIEEVRAARKASLIAELKAKKDAEEAAKLAEQARKEEEEKIAKLAEDRRKRDEAAAKQREIQEMAARKQEELRSSRFGDSPARRSPLTPSSQSPSPSPSQSPAPSSTPAASDRPMTFAEKMALKRKQRG